MVLLARRTYHLGLATIHGRRSPCLSWHVSQHTHSEVVAEAETHVLAVALLEATVVAAGMRGRGSGESAK